MEVGLIEDVFDHDESESVVADQGFEEVEDFADTLAVEAGEGFVEKEYSGASGDGTGDGDAFRLAKRHHVGGRGFAAPEAKAGEHGAGAGVQFGFAAIAAGRGDEGNERVFPRLGGLGDGNIVAKRLGAEEAHVLPSAADALTGDKLGRKVVERIEFLPPATRKSVGARGAVSEVFDRTSVGLEVAGEDVEQGGLARTVLAAQQDDLALAKIEVDAVNHDLTAKGLAQTASTEQQRASFGRTGK